MSQDAHPPTDSAESKVPTAIPTKPPGVITFPIASFDEAYPPDPFGEEAAEHARVWKVYRDQATEHDKKQLDGWNKTLDILLIFAGLYSAVLTAFLIESYHMLSEDSTDYMAKLLFQVVSANNGSLSLPVLQPAAGPIQPPGANFTLSTNALWINGLWFSSLALTLSVALLCILAKEWLTEYEGVVFARAPTAHYWTRRRELHHKGMKKWGVPFLISSLPSLLHVALFLFIVGLYLFLLPLDRGISIAVGAIGGTVLVFYLLHFIIPIWNTSCAFRSPLARHIRRAITEVWHRVLVLGSTLYSAVWYGRAAVKETPSSSALSREQITINARYALLDARALHWLLSSSTRSVASAAIQAIGSIRPASDTAERLRTLNIQSTVDGYMDTRTLELTERNILHNDAALAEHMHCVRAMLSVAGAAPVHGATPFMEMQHDLRNRDAQLLNHIVHIFRSRATTASTPSADTDSEFFHTLYPEIVLLDALKEHHTSKGRDPSTQTQSTCHPSTFSMLFDILQIRLARVHGIAKVSGEELEVTRADTPDPLLVQKFRAVLIHCALVIHLVHDLSPTNLDDNEAFPICEHLVQCSDFLSRTAPSLQFPEFTPFPPQHLETNSRFILFTTWICLTTHSEYLLFSRNTKEVLARDIAAMASTFAPAFNDQSLLAQITAEPYWTYVSTVAALDLPWTPYDLDGLIALYRHRRGNRNDIEEPRTRRPLALLINHVAILELEPGTFNAGGSFADFFCCDGMPAFSRRDFNDTVDDISYFVVSHNNSPSAWETLHSVICANRTPNTYVVQLAVSLASEIRSRLLAQPTADVQDDIIRFFGVRILGVCFSRLCADYLELASNAETSQSALEVRLQVAADFLADCACICPRRTGKQIWSLVRDTDTQDRDTLATSKMLGVYLGWVKEHNYPQQAQVTTMRLFSNDPGLDGVTPIFKLTAALSSGTTSNIPRAMLEASLEWDFWRARDLIHHQTILTTSQLLARRILASQSSTTVSVPATLLSVMKELVAQEATLPSDLVGHSNSESAVVEYMSRLGDYRRFVCENVQEPPPNAFVSDALLDMQRLAENFDM